MAGNAAPPAITHAPITVRQTGNQETARIPSTHLVSNWAEFEDMNDGDSFTTKPTASGKGPESMDFTNDEDFFSTEGVQASWSYEGTNVTKSSASVPLEALHLDYKRESQGMIDMPRVLVTPTTSGNTMLHEMEEDTNERANSMRRPLDSNTLFEQDFSETITDTYDTSSQAHTQNAASEQSNQSMADFNHSTTIHPATPDSVLPQDWADMNDELNFASLPDTTMDLDFEISPPQVGQTPSQGSLPDGVPQQEPLQNGEWSYWEPSGSEFWMPQQENPQQGDIDGADFLHDSSQYQDSLHETLRERLSPQENPYQNPFHHAIHYQGSAQQPTPELQFSPRTLIQPAQNEQETSQSENNLFSPSRMENLQWVEYQPVRHPQVSLPSAPTLAPPAVPLVSLPPVAPSVAVFSSATPISRPVRAMPSANQSLERVEHQAPQQKKPRNFVNGNKYQWIPGLPPTPAPPKRRSNKMDLTNPLYGSQVPLSPPAARPSNISPISANDQPLNPNPYFKDQALLAPRPMISHLLKVAAESAERGSYLSPYVSSGPTTVFQRHGYPSHHCIGTPFDPDRGEFSTTSPQAYENTHMKPLYRDEERATQDSTPGTAASSVLQYGAVAPQLGHKSTGKLIPISEWLAAPNTSAAPISSLDSPGPGTPPTDSLAYPAGSTNMAPPAFVRNVRGKDRDIRAKIAKARYKGGRTPGIVHDDEPSGIQNAQADNIAQMTLNGKGKERATDDDEELQGVQEVLGGKGKERATDSDGEMNKYQTVQEDINSREPAEAPFGYSDAFELADCDPDF